MKEISVINPRLVYLKIKAKWFVIVFFIIYSPTENKTQQEKEDFYTEITTTRGDK